MSKSIHPSLPRDEGRGEGPRKRTPARRACRQTVWMLAAAVIGCAAPSARLSQRLNSDGLTAEPAATARGFAERRDDMQFQLAEARWRRNELPICRQMLEDLLARNPSHRPANLRLAELYLSKNQPCQALALMQRFCRAHRDDAEAHHLLGLSYEALGQTDRALAAYDAAASLDPNDPLVRASLENAVAATDGHGPGLSQPLPSNVPRSADAAGSKVVLDEDEALVDLPPSRAPGVATAPPATSQEPQRLDAETGDDAGLALKGPRIEIVSVPVATKAGPARDKASAETATARVPTAPTAKPPPPPPATADSSLHNSAGSEKPPARWAYELEVDEARPALPPDSNEPVGAAPEGASPEAAKEEAAKASADGGKE